MIDLYSDCTKEEWRDIWDVNVRMFLAVVGYAQNKLRKKERLLKNHGR